MQDKPSSNPKNFQRDEIDQKSKALDSVVVIGSPLVAEEDTVRVEHWDNLEDEILPEAASDVMRRHKKVNQTLQKYFHPDWLIAKLDLDNKGGGGLSRMYPRHDEHYFHLFKNNNRIIKNNNRITIYSVHCYLFATFLENEFSNVLCLSGKNHFHPLHRCPASPFQHFIVGSKNVKALGVDLDFVVNGGSGK